MKHSTRPAIGSLGFHYPIDFFKHINDCGKIVGISWKINTGPKGRLYMKSAHFELEPAWAQLVKAPKEEIYNLFNKGCNKNFLKGEAWDYNEFFNFNF